MNAHTHKHLVAAPSTEAATCPVAAVGRRLAAVQARLYELEAPARGNSPVALRVDHEWMLLHDLRDDLDSQMEWLRASSLAGLYWQAAQLGVILEGVAADMTPSADDSLDMRRLKRLHNAITEGLASMGGFSAEDLGAQAKIYRNGEFEAVLDLIAAER